MKNNKNFFELEFSDIFDSAIEINRTAISSLPQTSGVYFIFQENHEKKLKYVGQAINLYKRISGHNKIRREKMKVSWVEIPEECLDLAEYFFVMRFAPTVSKRKPDVDILNVMKLYYKLKFDSSITFPKSFAPIAKDFIFQTQTPKMKEEN